MKKFVLAFCCGIVFSYDVAAEIYHNIDIDEVYAQSDWSSKDKIKEIIDDYSYLLQYKNKLTLCDENANQLNCINNLTQEIMRRFYHYNYPNNINDYQIYVKSTFAAYGVAYCLNRYNVPSGTVCEQEKNHHVTKLMKQYAETLLSQTEKSINSFSFIKNYK